MSSKITYGILTVLVVLYLFVRLLILAGSMDQNHHDEELFRGNIAKELISGPILPFFDYQRSEYEGGCLVAGVLAVPFFALFGDNLFSLKLVALSFPILALIAWYLFLDKFFGRKAAILAGLLWVFSPPFFTKWGLLTYGEYSELNFFTIAAIFIFSEIFFVQERKWLYVLLGLVSGFASFFHYYFLILLSVLLLFWFLFDKRFFLRRTFFIFAGFFLLGFSPWIYYNATHQFEGFIVSDKPVLEWFSQNSLWAPFVRIKDLAIFQIADSFGFTDLGVINHYLPAYAYYLVFVLAFSCLIYANRRLLVKGISGLFRRGSFTVAPKEMKPEILLMAFFLAFCVIFSLSRFKFWADFYECYVNRYRYLIPMYPLIFAFIAIFYQRVSGIRNSAAAQVICGLVLIVPSLGIIYNLALISPENFGKNYIALTKGYNYYDLGKIICWRSSDPAKSIESARGIKSEHDRMLCYAGMGWGFAKEKFSKDYVFYIRHVLPALDKKYWPQACERIGTVTGYNEGLVRTVNDNLDMRYLPYFYRGFGVHAEKHSVFELKEYTRLAQVIDARYQPYFHEGIGIELDEALFSDADRFFRFMSAVDEKFRPYVYKELAEGRMYYQFNYSKFGFGIGKIGYDINVWNKIINKIEDAYRPQCYQRLGIEIGWRFIHDVKKYRLFLGQADTRYLPVLYKGIGIGIGWRFGYDIAGCTRLIEEMERKYWLFLYEGLGAGSLRQRGFRQDNPAIPAEAVPPDYRHYFYRGLNEP